MAINDSGWNEYSKLVLNELENLGKHIDDLKSEVSNVKQEVLKMQVREEKQQELFLWKGKIDEIASPTQLKNLIKNVDELKTFKTKIMAIFAVLQIVGMILWSLFTKFI